MNAVTAVALFQCLASACIVCVNALTLALSCTMTNHFCVIRVPLWYGLSVWCKI